MAQIAPYIFPQFFDDNGDPLNGGLIYAYAAGTTTPQNTYSNAAGTSANTNPIVLSSSGRTKVFLQNLAYDFVIKNSAGETIDSISGVGSAAISGGASFIDTISELRALASGAFNYVEVGGYATKGDGGGGLFYWDATETAADLGVNVQPNSLPAAGRWIRQYSGEVNVKWFGAKGDGVTDDSPAIAAGNTYVASLANGGTLYFPESSVGYLYTSNPSFNAKTFVRMESGARFISAGVALTFAGKFDASPRSVFSASVGAVSFSGPSAVRPEWWGALGDGATDDLIPFQKAATAASGGGIALSRASYKISQWNINGFTNGLTFFGQGATATRLVFGSGSYGLRIDGNSRKVRFLDLRLDFPENVTQDCIQMGKAGSFGDSANFGWECGFHRCYIQGNPTSSLQNGIVFENSFVNQFVDCHIFEFNKNIVFKFEANSNNFYGCSIRANQTGSNDTLIEALDGACNTFYGGDIENCNSILRLGDDALAENGTRNLVFDGVYFEATTALSMRANKGSVVFNKCFWNEVTIDKYEGATVIMTKNDLKHHTSGQIVRFRTANIGPFVCKGNRVDPGATATGVLLRGASNVVQWFDGATNANGTISGYFDLNQNQIFDVNAAGAPAHFVLVNNDNGRFVGAMGFGAITCPGTIANSGLAAANALLYANASKVHTTSADLAFDGTDLTLGGTGSIIKTGAAATNRRHFFRTGASNRAAIGVNSTAEGGSDAGSDVVISLFSDAGAGLGDFFTMSRANGIVNWGARVCHRKAGVAVTAAADTSLGTGGNAFNIAVGANINGIATANWQSGSEVTLIFAGATTVNHNTAASAGFARIFLNGSANLVAAANTVLTLIYDGTQWQEKCRKVA